MVLRAAPRYAALSQRTPRPMTPAQGEPRTLYAALAAFQAEMPTVAKTKTAQLGNYSYRYADLADISEIAMPLLAALGLSFSCAPEVTERGQVLHGTLWHSSGDSLQGTLAISGQRPQEVGSALTYARRYLLGCLTGIVTDDDDDAQMAQGAKRRKAAEKPPQPAGQPAGSGVTVRRKPAGRPLEDVSLPPEQAAPWNDPWAVDPAAGQAQPPGEQPHAAPQVAPPALSDS